LTGEEIFSESILSIPPPEELTWTDHSRLGIRSGPIVVDGRYLHFDFDFGRYAEIMEAHINR